jgi:hypothetical protein
MTRPARPTDARVERKPTAQEDVIYNALTEGDTQAIEAISADVRPDPAPVEEAPVEPSPEPADPVEQFEEDYEHAWRRYQADNETDEAERVRLTAEAAKRDNHDAMEGI